MSMPLPGQVLRAVSGTRPISVTVVRVNDEGVTLRCNSDWTWQEGMEFTVPTEHFPHTIFGRAA